MHIVLFYHSLVSDWNHGNAHFLRGVVSELRSRRHKVRVYEPADGWSLKNLVANHGVEPLRRFRAAYPGLSSTQYLPRRLDLDESLDGADLVIVHEWNEPSLVARIGRHRVHSGKYKLLFHDTHHRSMTNSNAMVRYDLRHYDGVLAFGNVIRELYLARGWAARAWTWHEAADVRRFRPMRNGSQKEDLVWIGNWGDEERTREIEEFLLEPAKTLGLRASVYGVRYPDAALRSLSKAGIRYHGWLPNFEVPKTFAHHRATVHIPRRPYVKMLPGIPTIRIFEALACGIPLVSAPWEDAEGLFRPGRDFLIAKSGTEMLRHLRALLADPELARELRTNGLKTIRHRHTCAHRVDELITIYKSLKTDQICVSV